MSNNITVAIPDLQLYKKIKSIISEDKQYRLVDNQTKGTDILLSIRSSNTKLIILTQQLDDMTAYEFIHKLMITKPTPCLLLFVEAEERIEVDRPKALDYGIVATHELTIIDSKIQFRNSIISRLYILAKLSIDKFRSQIHQINRQKPRFTVSDKSGDKLARIREVTTIQNIKQQYAKVKIGKLNVKPPSCVIVIGASTGGPKTLIYIISQFPISFPPVLVVQHMPDTFVGAFADRMNQNSRMNVKLAQEGDILRNGWIYVAPGGVHMELEKSSPRHVRVRFDDGAKVNFVKPAVDVTLFSAARIFKNRVISVVLTGMGSDGREGTRIVKKLGGQSIALKEEESIIYGMNKSVIDAGLADHILGMDGIVKQLAKMVYSAKTTKVNN